MNLKIKAFAFASFRHQGQLIELSSILLTSFQIAQKQYYNLPPKIILDDPLVHFIIHPIIRNNGGCRTFFSKRGVLSYKNYF